MNGRTAIAVCIVLVGTLACGVGAGANTEPDLAATITAQALQQQTRLGTPAAASPTGTSAATLRVTSATECREGPSQEFELAFTANPGRVFKLAGKNTASNYWIVEDPAGGTCWLMAARAVVEGSTGSLPELPLPVPMAGANSPSEPSEEVGDPSQLYRWVTIEAPRLASSTEPPPTRIGPPVYQGTLQPPKPPESASAMPTTVGLPPLLITILPPKLGPAANPPTLLSYERSCEELPSDLGVVWLMLVGLTWSDSNNETGYRVSMGYYPLDSLPQDSTQYTAYLSHGDPADSSFYPPPEVTNLAVVAFNENGPSPRAEVWVPTCP